MKYGKIKIKKISISLQKEGDSFEKGQKTEVYQNENIRIISKNIYYFRVFRIALFCSIF